MKHGLIITHAGSGGTLLCRILSTNLTIRSYGRTGLIYDHPAILARVRQHINYVMGTPSKSEYDWYIDKLIYNRDLTNKAFYNICKFIYMVRSPEIPLATLISQGYPPQGAETYYLFRLRRMCEMANKTGGILLTYEDLITKRAFPLLKNTLKLKSPLSHMFTPMIYDESNLLKGEIIQEPLEPNYQVPEDILERCINGYNRYFNFLENQTGLIRFSI